MLDDIIGYYKRQIWCNCKRSTENWNPKCHKWL